jgi:GNAT superfamily N-acetyltransferase
MLARVIGIAADADVDAGARLLGRVHPEGLFSGESLRHARRTAPPEARRVWWCAEEQGELVGWASCARMTDTSEHGVGWAGVSVAPERRLAGIGSALLEAAEQHALELGVRRLLVSSRGDDRSASFARARGYTQTGSNDMLVVDPRTVDPPEPPAEVELVPFTAFAGDPKPIFDVDAASMLDEPSDAHLDTLGYDRWLDWFWRHPFTDHDASTVAVVDAQAVAFTFLWSNRRLGRGVNSGTGTLRGFRGRGLATLAKRASLRRAAELGCNAVYTGNNAENAPMLAINRKLGYRVSGTELNWAKQLAPPAVPSA